MLNLFAEQGCNCSISTNNILNPFTPFGDCSLIRMANMHANVLQVGQPDRLTELFSMISDRSARLINAKDYGIKVGSQAEVTVIDAEVAGRGGRDQRAGAGGVQAWAADRESPAGRVAPPTINGRCLAGGPHGSHVRCENVMSLPYARCFLRLSRRMDRFGPCAHGLLHSSKQKMGSWTRASVQAFAMGLLWRRS